MILDKYVLIMLKVINEINAMLMSYMLEGNIFIMCI